MKKFIFLFLLFALIPATGCYAKGPWKGKVIDAETKQPIEGAAVVAVWEREYAGPAGTVSHFFDARETLTDKDGNFEIPSLSALSIPLIRNIYGPRVTIFKPGYGSFPWHQISPQKDLLTVFEGKGSVVELPKLTDSNERVKSLDSAESTIDDIPLGKIEKFIILIDEENKNLGFSLRRHK
jgi:hypothetical protein